MSTKLLSEIEQFIRERGMSEFRFGLKAVKNGRLVERLRNGGRIWPDTETKVRAFMLSEKGREARQ